jgi:hypothetical protein
MAVFDFLFNAFTLTMIGIAVIILVVAAISGRPRQRLPWVAALATCAVSAPLVIEAVHNFLLWADPNQPFAGWLFSRLLGTVVGLFAGIVAGEFTHAALRSFGIGFAVLQPATSTPFGPVSGNAVPAQMITTAFETAGSVRSFREASDNTYITDAQITVLRNAERLALAAAHAADAEAKGIEAVLRRANRLSELHTRQIVEHEMRGEQLAGIGQKLVLADLQREKEFYENARKTLEAKHSFEATEQFKSLKFQIGRARARARKSDAEVDGKTAEAAVVKIAGDLAKLSRRKNANVDGWLDRQIARAETAIEEAEADGEDTAETRVELNLLRRLKNVESVP